MSLSDKKKRVLYSRCPKCQGNEFYFMDMTDCDPWPSSYLICKNCKYAYKNQHYTVGKYVKKNCKIIKKAVDCRGNLIKIKGITIKIGLQVPQMENG